MVSASANNDTIISNRKRSIVTALCKFKNLDPEQFLGDVESDVKTLSIKILKAALENDVELTRWITFSEKFPSESEACLKDLNELNEDLTQKSVLFGGGLKPSEADIVVFAAVHSSVIGLPDSHKAKVPHLMRWMDYIQSVHDLGEIFEHISVKRAQFYPPLAKAVAKVEVELTTKKTDQGVKDTKSSEAQSSVKKNADVKKVTGNNEAAEEKKLLPEKVASEKDAELGVSLLKIQVGLIRKASKHPSADSLLVEEIDVGENKCRQVVSGLAKYCTPDELTNRLVVLITNVKPGKLRDVISEGLVLCASNEDHTKVEPLIVPEGAKVGECVLFSGHKGKPEDVLNPKKKQLEKITPHLFTDEKGVATFKGVPFMTSAGPCTSSIPKASVK